MKNWLLYSMMAFMSIMVLSGCSLLQGVNNTVEYVNGATDYINTASTFADEVPALAEQAVSDKNARAELEERLNQMKSDIAAFNELDPPGVGEGVHKKIVGYNDTLEQGIDGYLSKVENGEVDPKLLEDYKILKTINQLTSIKEQLEQLGS
ncbi:DUF6376 family protein [Pseudalkalibacillus salsuginis]|uniref:DUF6376 family protein n=1 Tax=Pseudalkalibacillus salsuginis TaxID=2910972 RepID=UPI001F16041C|nr:DUF6376 family protein [Pseudalkalibacillus salsuginis]MCF6410354.1 DUF6376 family protein [Pseudalkalibacillus salsuginis]